MARIPRVTLPTPGKNSAPSKSHSLLLALMGSNTHPSGVPACFAHPSKDGHAFVAFSCVLGYVSPHPDTPIVFRVG
eukprot:1162324-Alexandrium_andersonii.AAC.1